MRPTWKAETIVDPFANVSGSTSVAWLVVLDALHVACVNGSELIFVTAAWATAPTASIATSATPTASATRWDRNCSDRRISFSLSTTTRPYLRSPFACRIFETKHTPSPTGVIRGSVQPDHPSGLCSAGRAAYWGRTSARRSNDQSNAAQNKGARHGMNGAFRWGTKGRAVASAAAVGIVTRADAGLVASLLTPV